MSFNSNYTPSRLYYDINVTNVNTESSSNPELAFSETRTDVIVKDPSNYYMSIVRFSLDTPSLPVFFPIIQSDQSNYDLTVYSVSMVYNNITVQQYIYFVPQDQSQTIPNPPIYNTPKLQQFSAYYFVFNYEYFINLINTALSACFNTLSAQTDLSSTTTPYLKWNNELQTATLYAEQSYYSSSNNSNPINVYFNNALFQLFSSFPIYAQSSSAKNGLNYLISCNAFGNASVETINNITYLLCEQEYSTTSIWSPVSSVVFTTNTMPIISELLSAPTIYINGDKYQSTTNTGISNVITDFEATNMMYTPFLSYQPSIYRYVELYGSSPLTTIDIRCFWKNKVGQLIPFYLNSGCSASLKVMFALKGTQN